ncbi:hypothetical protein Tco_0757263 [Tanacetum coccineum]
MKCLRLSETLVIVLMFGCAMCKECTNIPTEISSHTFWYNLLNYNHVTYKKEVYSHYDKHLTPTDDNTWASLIPKKILREGGEFSWMITYKKIKNSGIGGGGGGEFLREVPVSDVRLDADTIYGRAQQINLEYLLMLDVDRLVYSCRETTGLPNFEVAYSGWEAPDQELCGHFQEGSRNSEYSNSLLLRSKKRKKRGEGCIREMSQSLSSNVPDNSPEQEAATEHSIPRRPDSPTSQATQLPELELTLTPATGPPGPSRKRSRSPSSPFYPDATTFSDGKPASETSELNPEDVTARLEDIEVEIDTLRADTEDKKLLISELQDSLAAAENEISLLQIRVDDAESRHAEDHEQIQKILARLGL